MNSGAGGILALKRLNARVRFGHQTVKLLSDPLFLDFWVPLITVGATVLLRMNSRKDSFELIRKEDLSIGFELTVTSLFLIAVKSAEFAKSNIVGSAPDRHVTEAPWILLAATFGLTLVGMLVRKWGWSETREPTILIGLIVPDAFGVACLIFALQWIKNPA